MVSLLLIISFLLHLISLYAIFQLYQLLKRQRQQDASEIASLFDTYLDEIKLENEQLEERLLDLKSQRIPSETEMVNKGNDEIQQNIKVEEDEVDLHLPNVEEVQDEVEASLESQVLQLSSEGLSPEDIARKLNRGKTEVELIVKLYKKNNSNA